MMTPDSTPLPTDFGATAKQLAGNQQLLAAFQRFESGGLTFEEIPLPKLPKAQGFALIDSLYSPDERFAQGFYKYKVDILKHPEQLAWQNTLEELEHYKDTLKATYDTDDCVYSVGYYKADSDPTPENYVPVGIYCMRPLSTHERGEELLQALADLNLSETYAGNQAIVHSFSLLKDFRNLEMLKYIFISIGLKALKAGYPHIFFFMSDYRLKSIYKRYGLTFPADLKFRNSQHTIGCYSLSEDNLTNIVAALQQLMRPANG